MHVGTLDAVITQQTHYQRELEFQEQRNLHSIQLPRSFTVPPEFFLYFQQLLRQQQRRHSSHTLSPNLSSGSHLSGTLDQINVFPRVSLTFLNGSTLKMIFT